jgi:hypothetical protein
VTAAMTTEATLAILAPALCRDVGGRPLDGMVALASGHADRLSGRHLSVADNLGALLPRIDQIERDDLHTLRLRTGH